MWYIINHRLILYVLNAYAIELIHEVDDAHFVFVSFHFDIHVDTVGYAGGDMSLFHAVRIEFHTLVAQVVEDHTDILLAGGGEHHIDRASAKTMQEPIESFKADEY